LEAVFSTKDALSQRMYSSSNTNTIKIRVFDRQEYGYIMALLIKNNNRETTRIELNY
jgi:hypothetical protein